ncbi:hypothetical protein L9F63_027567, partial [Diploptera punctata]
GILCLQVCYHISWSVLLLTLLHSVTGEYRYKIRAPLPPPKPLAPRPPMPHFPNKPFTYYPSKNKFPLSSHRIVPPIRSTQHYPIIQQGSHSYLWNGPTHNLPQLSLGHLGSRPNFQFKGPNLIIPTPTKIPTSLHSFRAPGIKEHFLPSPPSEFDYQPPKVTLSIPQPPIVSHIGNAIDDDKGPIHTIPAPNLAPNSNTNIHYELGISKPQSHTQVTIQQSHGYEILDPNAGVSNHLSSQELFELFHAPQQPQQQLVDSYGVPVHQQQPQSQHYQQTNLFPNSNYITQDNQGGIKTDFNPEFQSFNYEEQYKNAGGQEVYSGEYQEQEGSENVPVVRKSPEGTLTSYQNENYEQKSNSLSEGNSYYDNDANNADGYEKSNNNDQNDSKQYSYFPQVDGGNGALGSSYYTTLPNREAAETLATLAAAGNINSHLANMKNAPTQPPQITKPVPVVYQRQKENDVRASIREEGTENEEETRQSDSTEETQQKPSNNSCLVPILIPVSQDDKPTVGHTTHNKRENLAPEPLFYKLKRIKSELNPDPMQNNHFCSDSNINPFASDLNIPLSVFGTG